MQNGFDAPLPGFGMLFAQNLAMKEYYDSLSYEIGQEAEEHRLELNAVEDMKSFTDHK
jgi:hypothetical protein